MTLILRPPGRGNWAPLVLHVQGQRAAPLLVRVGDRLPIGGQVYRVSKVMA